MMVKSIFRTALILLLVLSLMFGLSACKSADDNAVNLVQRDEIEKVSDILLSEKDMGEHKDIVERVIKILKERYPDDEFYPLAIPEKNIGESSLGIVFVSDKVIESCEKDYNKHYSSTKKEWKELSLGDILENIQEEAQKVRDVNQATSSDPVVISVEAVWEGDNIDSLQVKDNYAPIVRYSEIFDYLESLVGELLDIDFVLGLNSIPKPTVVEVPFALDAPVADLLKQKDSFGGISLTILIKEENEKQIHELIERFSNGLYRKETINSELLVHFNIVEERVDIGFLHEDPIRSGARGYTIHLKEYAPLEMYEYLVAVREINGDKSISYSVQYLEKEADVFVEKVWDEAKESFVDAR